MNCGKDDARNVAQATSSPSAVQRAPVRLPRRFERGTYDQRLNASFHTFDRTTSQRTTVDAAQTTRRPHGSSNTNATT